MNPRPLPITVTAVLLALISLAGLPAPLLPGAEQIPAIVVYGGTLLNVLGLVAAVGLWMTKRWSMWLTMVVMALGIASAAPGVAFAPNVALQVAAAVGVVVPALIIVLVVLPTSRRALAPA